MAKKKIYTDGKEGISSIDREKIRGSLSYIGPRLCISKEIGKEEFSVMFDGVELNQVLSLISVEWRERKITCKKLVESEEKSILDLISYLTKVDWRLDLSC